MDWKMPTALGRAINFTAATDAASQTRPEIMFNWAPHGTVRLTHKINLRKRLFIILA